MSPPLDSALVLALLAFGASGCDGATKASGQAAPTATPVPSPAVASATAPAAAPDPKQLLATCTDKGAATCKEYHGELPALVEDLCRGLDGKGVLAKGASPCSRERLLGVCTIDRGSSSEVHLHYAEEGLSANDAHTACELRAGAWQAATASTTPR